MANITINLKNCGCCGDGSSGSQPDVPYNDLGDPGDPSGPPSGYSDPGLGIEDRQCKTAVWLYAWLEATLDLLANTDTGYYTLLAFSTIQKYGWIAALTPVFVAAITLVVDLLAIPSVTDLFKAALAGMFAASLVAALQSIKTNITQAFVQDAIPIVQGARDYLICSLASASNGPDARQRLGKGLGSLDLSLDQKLFINALAPNALLSLLFFSADWWPSFDDDILSGVTDTCCGGYAQGEPTSGDKQCQASYYIIDQLITTAQITGQFSTDTLDYIPFNYDRAEIYGRLQSGLADAVPSKIVGLTDYAGYLTAVTEIIYSYWPAGVFSLPTFLGLATYMSLNRSALAGYLAAAVDVNDAYGALSDDLETWIDGNVTDPDTALHAKSAIDALINPVQQHALLSLLFEQDAELAFYALAECSGGGGDEYYLTAIDDVTYLKPNTYHDDEAEILGGEDGDGLLVAGASEHLSLEIYGDFGAIYEGATQLTMWVKSDYDPTNYSRRWYYCDMQVKADAGDEWLSVGLAYFNNVDLEDGLYHERNWSFSSRNVRYIKMRLSRGGNAFGIYAHMRIDAVKITVPA